MTDDKKSMFDLDAEQIQVAPYEEYPTKPADELRTILDGVDASKVAEEILDWLINNVTNYVDSQETVYSINVGVDKESTTMPNSAALQDAYLAVPEDDEKVANELWDKCDQLVSAAKEAMQDDSDRLKQLFEKLIFYYEMTGVTDKGLILQQFDGNITLGDFYFDPVPLTVEVRQKQVGLEDAMEDVADGEQQGEVISQKQIPEAFAIEFEIAYWKRNQPTAMY